MATPSRSGIPRWPVPGSPCRGRSPSAIRGFDRPVTLASTAAYFDLFDENSLDPDPDASTSDGDRVLWEFEVPESGDTMEVSPRHPHGPNVQWGTRGATAVLVDGKPVASVEYHTWVMP